MEEYLLAPTPKLTVVSVSFYVQVVDNIIEVNCYNHGNI